MVKVTKEMLNRLMRQHERTETMASLRKHNAMAYLYGKQTGNKAYIRGYAFAKKDAEALAKKLPTKRKPVRRTSGFAGNPFGFRPPRF